MKLYQYKPIKLGFVVLCLENNPGVVKITVNSIRRRYDCSIVVAVGENVSNESFDQIEKTCPSFRGKNTITSLINVGMDNALADWNMVMVAGTYVRHNLDKKYSYFIEKELDIMYAIIDGYYEFPDCSLNGIAIHRNAWNKIGHFCSQSPLQICKIMWAQRAIDLGAQFKGIIGVNMV